MEEATEAHMETDVSSTTDDVQVTGETPAPAAPRRDVETIITVESIKEEDFSPKIIKDSKSTDRLELKIAPKLPQDVTIKKIIIKSPLKDVQVKSLQKLPSKPEEPKNSSPNKSVQPSIGLPCENSVDSSSRSEDKVSSDNINGGAQDNSINSSDAEKTVLGSPNKGTQLQESASLNDSAKNISIKEQTSGVQTNSVKERTIKTPPQKDPPLKIILTKENSKSFVVKESPTKTYGSKETPKTSDKETPNKSTQSKEAIIKTPSVKEVIAKTTPSRETTVKTPQSKEQPEKNAPNKDPPSKNTNTTEKPENENKMEDNKNRNVSVLEDIEVSNDSQTNSDVSDKDHNKSISRELRSLINSAKESKIISECTQLTSKTRKSRALDSANTSLNASVEADKMGMRRLSDNSQRSNSSEKSDRPVLKRSMRSQNPEFVSKVKNFLSSVSGRNPKKEEEDNTDEEMEEKKDKLHNDSSKEAKEVKKEATPSKPKKQKTEGQAPPTPEKHSSNKLRIDPYCWRCHWGTTGANEKTHTPMHCSVCPRTFHYKCLTSTERSKIDMEKNWVCPECLQILQAESSETRSPAMKKISLGMLCDLLKHALDRMMEVNGVEPFMHPVDRASFPDYDKYVVHPMDLGMMREHITEGLYGSTEAFLSDCQWILHNSIIFNTLQSKLTGGARALLRSCRAEMSEIEACPECYAAAHARRPTWFTDVCSTPHILLWAKLKGFPYWPAKGMSVNCSGMVDVRFFGAHDRAWVPARDCYLYSEKDPNNFRTKRQDILDSMQEAEQHIRNISRKYGKFVYPPFKTQFEPSKLNEQIKLMIPSFEGDVRGAVKEARKSTSPGSVKEKSRSNSKSSKGSFNDGDTSDGEAEVPARKMADGAEIAREEDYAVDKDKDKDKTMEVDTKETKDGENSRKRRRSDLEEATITIIDSNKEKRKKTDTDVKEVEKKETKDVKEHEKEQEKAKDKESKDAKAKEAEASTSTDKKNSPKLTPIRVISIAKVMKNAKTTPKVVVTKEEDKPSPKPKVIVMKEEDKTPAKQKKVDKSATEKDRNTPQEDKKLKRRNSKNKSLNNSNVGKSEKAEKKGEKSTETPKDKAKDTTNKNNGPESEKPIEKTVNKIQFDDDTSLAVLAREGKGHPTGLPTITSVRSLSTTATGAAKTSEVTEAPSDSSVFTPSGTDNVKNLSEAVNKIQEKPKSTDPPVGRVGVRAFARMTSPPNREVRPNEVEVEIKTEPIDVDDDRQLQEKMNLMNAFKLRPVNPPTNLREVRINKVLVTPLTRKGSTPNQMPQIRPRAKKTFPQPKKADEGRSELTSKNSMVYIPIQPPMTQAPVRGPRPQIAPTVSSAPTVTTPTSLQRGNTLAPASSNSNTANNSLVNTVTAPLVPSSVSTFTSPSSSASNASTPGAPTVGQVPTTVHTMPMFTSVNGQWTLSLQPVLSVGGVDTAPSPSTMNGLPERTLVPIGAQASPALVPTGPTLVQAGPTLVPAGSTGATLVPTGSSLVSTAPAVPALATLSTNSSQNSSRSSNNTPGELPRLQQRPALINPLDPNAPISSVPPPSTVGPLTAKLNQNAVKMTDFFRTLLEDTLDKLDEPAAYLTSLKLQLEQVQWRHHQEINEIKHNHELIVMEMRSSFEKEKLQLVAEARRHAQAELDAAVKQAKAKQWCANCNQEAQFYCCWNTSYCDYPCQRAHWTHHYAVCTQQRSQENSSGDASSSPESRLQQAPDNLPKTTAAPNLTAASKLQPSRVYQEQGPKPSIIVSMVEDNTGNQTMKCVGTFKPPSSAPVQMSPLILNKQIMNSEEAAKKVVTSGGYLIVGASNSLPISTTITPTRRAPAIQYIS